MCDLIVSVPDHCLFFYFSLIPVEPKADKNSLHTGAFH